MAKHQHQVGKKKYFRIQPTINGIKKSFYGKSMAEARAKAEEFRQAHATNNSKKCNITVREYVAFHLQLIKNTISEETFVGYEEKLRLRVLPFLGDKLLTDITHDDITRVMAGVSLCSRSYRHTLLMLLRRIFKAAQMSHHIQDDPTEGVKILGGKQREKKPALTDKQCQQLLFAVKGTPAETFCRIGLYAGPRREEILALFWDALFLDTDNPYIEIKRAWRIKNNRPVISKILKTDAAHRKIPIPQHLAEHLRILRAEATSPYVFSNSSGEPLTGTQWRNLWGLVERRTTASRKYVRYGKNGKTEHIVTPNLDSLAKNNPSHRYSLDFTVTAHQLRYTYITNLIAAGLDVKKVQYLAGHKSAKITLEIYARVKGNQPEELSDVINSVFGSDACDHEGK